MSRAWIPARNEQTRDEKLLVSEPSCFSEFEVQAYLWTELRQLGINVRGEVKCQFSGRAQVRFDLAVFDGGRLVGVIECKREGKQMGSDWRSTRQGARYAQFGVPVRLVKGMEEAKAVLADAKRGLLWSKPP